MLRLHAEPLSPAWFDFLTSLFSDLAPLGHFARPDANGGFALGTTAPLDRSANGTEKLWDLAHHLRQQAMLRVHQATVMDFERDFGALFVDMTRFQPSAVKPTLQIVDWKNPDHLRIVDYLRLSQCVAPGKLVGRRMGLLIWDIGQEDIKLMGAAVLASPRYSQRVRDDRLGWRPDFPRTSPHFDPVARAIRVAGLERMMHLSMACVLPPYNFLAGAWLAAMAPFTDVGLEAFRLSVGNRGADFDLAAVVTTSGKSIYGAPFKGHRVAQIAPGVSAAEGASGDLYQRAVPRPGFPPLRASFEDLVSPAVQARAQALFQAERPDAYARLANPGPSAMAYALRRLGCHRSLFDGNDMGVHIGALGADTFDHLRDGSRRPANARPLLEWKQVVGVWTRKFLPASAAVGESAMAINRDEHRVGRKRRLEAARAVPQAQVYLSSLIGTSDPAARLRVADVAPVI